MYERKNEYMQGIVMDRIASIKPFSTKTEALLIAKLEEIDFGEIMYMSITELAIRLEVAEATILRFCKKLGYKGFQDFKLAISKDLAAPASQKINEDEIYQKISAGLDFTVKNLKQENLKKTVQYLMRAKRIVLFGVGNSSIAMHYLELALLKRGINTLCSSDSHSQTLFASSLDENDLAILISVSGSTLDVLELAELYQAHKVPIVVITNYEKSPLAKYADVIFVSSRKEAPYEGGNSSSVISQIYIFDTILQEFSKIQGETEGKYHASENVSRKAV